MSRPGMFVVKRDGRQEDVHFDKITARIRKLCYGLDMRYIDPVAVAMKVVQGIYPGVTTRELDQLAAETCACATAAARSALRARWTIPGAAACSAAPRALVPVTNRHSTERRRALDLVRAPVRPLAPAGAYSSTYHPDWSTLAARIAVSDLHKMTDTVFSRNCTKLAEHRHPKVRGQGGQEEVQPSQGVPLIVSVARVTCSRRRCCCTSAALPLPLLPPRRRRATPRR
jgi:hypothetical protein